MLQRGVARAQQRVENVIVVTLDGVRWPEGFGGASLECLSRRIWIAVLGATTPALSVRTNVETTQAQVAATIAALLGSTSTPRRPV